MQRDLKRLRAITRGCRADMHEPDEQDLKCRVVGDHLDNAFGEHINAEAIIRGSQEFVVVLERITEHGVQIEAFSLANLIALARFAWSSPYSSGEGVVP